MLDEGQSHRPLIACTLVGLVLGDLKTGIILGGTLELMALGWMNVGLAMAPDTAIASVISTILVITADQGIGEGIAVAIALAAAGSSADDFCSDHHSIFNSSSRQIREEGNFKGIEIMHITAMAFSGSPRYDSNFNCYINQRKRRANFSRKYSGSYYKRPANWRRHYRVL